MDTDAIDTSLQEDFTPPAADSPRAQHFDPYAGDRPRVQSFDPFSAAADVEQQLQLFVQERPVAAVFAALGIGYLVARIFSRR
jgi:hypothetical protein